METTKWMIRTIHLPSRWDIFKLPIDDLPEGQFQVKGADGSWFLTNKEEMILGRKLDEQMKEIEMHYLLGYKPKKHEQRTRTDESNPVSTSSGVGQ